MNVPNDFCSGDGFSSSDGIRRCVGRYRGDYKGAKLLLLGQFLCLASPNSPGAKAARYRACLRSRSRSFIIWVSRPHFSATHWRSQRNARLAHLRRISRGAPIARLACCIATSRWVGVGPDPLCADSTTIDLCLAMFPGRSSVATRVRSSAYSARSEGSIPTNVYVTSGAVHDITFWTNCCRSGSVLSARPRILGLRASVRAQTRVRFLSSRAPNRTRSSGVTVHALEARSS